MFDQIAKDLKGKMEKSLTNLQEELAKLRTGRASVALLDMIRVDYYGTPTPLNQMATINVPEPRLLVVQPWDQSAISDIEKAIQKSDLGLVPQNDGKLIRLPIPPLTEDRRKELVKIANKYGEENRVAIRSIRRVGIDEIKKAEKDKKFSEDDSKRAQSKVQEMTDSYIQRIEQMIENKSKEILEV